MNFLNKDLVFYLGLRLDPCEILKFSQASKKCNQVLCSNNLFWRSKLLKNYFSEDEIKRFSNDTDFKELYQKMYENKYVITEDRFDEFSKFDRKYLTNITIKITYSINSQNIHFGLMLDYEDNYRDYKLSSYFQTDVIDKLRHIFYQKKGYEITNSHNYNKIFTTEDIYNLFHPLLLHYFKEHKISLNDMYQRELISTNFVELFII